MPGRNAVGLDIGTTAVRAAQLSFGRGPATLQRFGQVALPPGAVRDGEVVDPETVARAIRQLWGSAKFSSRRVVLGVANQKVVVRQVDLPWLPLPELRKVLPFQAQDYLPIPVEQTILDFHPVEEFAAEDGSRMLRVLLVAAVRDMVVGAVAAARKAGLTPVHVDLTPFAMLRALGPVDGLGLGREDAEALIDVGARVTNIVVHQAGAPRFIRILLMGGDDLTDAVAERMGVPPEEAETVKQETGLAPTPGAVTDHPAARALEAAGVGFVDEVRGSLDYYLDQPSSVPVRRLLVCGGGSRLGHLVDRLALATRLPVETANPLTALRLGRTRLSSEQLSYAEPVTAVPVGLALGVAS